MIGRKAKLELLLILAVVLVSQVICPLPNDSPEGDSEVGEVQTSGVNRLGKGTNVNNSKLSAKNNFPNVMPLKETATTTLESTTKSAEGASQGTAQKTLDGKKLSQGEQKSKSEEASTDIETTDKSS